MLMPWFDNALLAVITLPALAPLIALIQLLFPGLLGDHWKQYRAAIGVMLSQSSLYFLQWLFITWIVSEPQWWLTDRALAWGGVAVATLGYIGAVFVRPQPQAVAPVKVEYLAFWGLGLASGIWLVIQATLLGRSWLDPLLVIVVGCVATLLHFRSRQSWSAAGKPLRVPSEVVFLLVIMIGSATLNAYIYQSEEFTGEIAQVRGQASTARLDAQRTGSASSGDSGPLKPALLWSYPANAPKSGQMFLDSSPTVVGETVFVGGYTEILAYRQGFLHAIHARSGKPLWKYDAALRPVFSTPAVVDGKLYFGEGYHQDKNCRLFCFDAARGGEPLATYATSSHVESTPTIVDGRIYVGAGDDGLYCFPALASGAKQLEVAWHVPGIHVDASALVADGRVFTGGVKGDLVAKLQVLAVDAQSGDVLWQVPTELPVPAPPAYHDGGVLVSLGNGKLNKEADQPRGGVWRLDAKTGDRVWNFDTVSSVLSSPIVAKGQIYFAARDGECFCLSADQGKQVWRAPLGEPIVSAPIVSGGRMFVLSAHGNLHCLDAQTGRELWQFDKLRRSTVDVYSSPLLFGGRIYLCVGGKVHCVGDESIP